MSYPNAYNGTELGRPEEFMAALKHGNFGGDWTEEKLAKLARYLPAYAHILKDRSYKYGYIDAFAGPGYRARQRKQATPIEDLWGDDPDERTRRFTAGSAVVAMRSEPPFQSYIFIEQDTAALRKLEDALRKAFPQRISPAKFGVRQRKRGAQRAMCPRLVKTSGRSLPGPLWDGGGMGNDGSHCTHASD